jgi:hypothetical protein
LAAGGFLLAARFMRGENERIACFLRAGAVLLNTLSDEKLTN